MSISLAASDLDWNVVKDDAKKYGFNTVASYIQKLLWDSHFNLYNKRPRQLLRLALLLDTVLIFVILILVIVRF